MKTLGLIGGTSWVSTLDYYRIINQTINERLGGLESAKLLLHSLNFAEFKKLADENDWKTISEHLCSIARALEVAGAECILICANTPHKVAGDVRKSVRIPLIHIAEVTADEIKRRGVATVALLGTRFTMEDGFFRFILSERHIISIIPEAADRAFIHRTIFDELGKGIFAPQTKSRYLGIIQELADRGAKGVIFGCTEIPLLIKEEECAIPVFDTMALHSKAAVDFALSA